MSKGLKDMTLSELQEGYEKGKVTDEEIEQHLLEQIQRTIRKSLRNSRKNGFDKDKSILIAWRGTPTAVKVSKLAEHEYQKLKDNE